MSTVNKNRLKAERKAQAIDAFKDWSNYMLITTVAALGWVSTDPANVVGDSAKVICVVLFTLSVVLAIFTLALIPHVAERLGDDENSIYDIEITYKALPNGWERKSKLKSFCWWQHVTFLLGIVVYAIGVILGFLA